MSAGQSYAAHDAVSHGRREFVRGIVHANSTEGFSDRVRRTVVGVFSPHQHRSREPVFQRDRLSLVATDGRRTGSALHPQGPHQGSDAVGPDPHGPAAPHRVPLHHRPANAPNSPGRHRHPMCNRCLWLIKAAFLTMERRLPRNAEHIGRELGIEVFTPIRHWEMLRPWAGLWF